MSELAVTPATVKLNLSSGKFIVTENEKGKSTVWKDFGMVVNADTNAYVGYVKCKRCGELMLYDAKRTGNSAMSRHLDNVCKGRLPDRGGVVQTVVTGFASSSKRITQQSKSKLIDKCVAYCCKDIRPFLAVAGDGFLELAQELIDIGVKYGHVSAKDVMPDRTTVSKRCHDLTTEKRQQLIQQLNGVLSEVNHVGMTTDMWTEDYHKHSYMAITCHFITKSFELIGKVLTTAIFPPEEAKTGEHIRREIIRILVTEFGLDVSLLNKVVWVTDQGSNIIAALRPYTRLDCQDHVYNTVLRHALDATELALEDHPDAAPEVSATLHAAKSLVKYVKKSGIAALLSKTVNQMGDTRFSTVYLTLQSIKDVYDELRTRLEGRGESHRIDDISPDVLDFLVTFLKPFYDAQRELEGDKYPTINLVFLWFDRLTRHCMAKPGDAPYQQVIRRRHRDWIPRKIQINDYHKIATFLWPKYSQLRMMSSDEKARIHEEVTLTL